MRNRKWLARLLFGTALCCIGSSATAANSVIVVNRSPSNVSRLPFHFDLASVKPAYRGPGDVAPPGTSSVGSSPRPPRAAPDAVLLSLSDRTGSGLPKTSPLDDEVLACNLRTGKKTRKPAKEDGYEIPLSVDMEIVDGNVRLTNEFGAERRITIPEVRTHWFLLDPWSLETIESGVYVDSVESWGVLGLAPASAPLAQARSLIWLYLAVPAIYVTLFGVFYTRLWLGADPKRELDLGRLLILSERARKGIWDPTAGDILGEYADAVDNGVPARRRNLVVAHRIARTVLGTYRASLVDRVLKRVPRLF